MIKCGYGIFGAFLLSSLITAQETVVSKEQNEEIQSFEKTTEPKDQKVQIKVYYESLCHDSRIFDTVQFAEVIEKLSPYVDIRMIPYGNAETIERDGKYDFRCQHGPSECYGNKLHACALNLIGNMTKAILFNSCLMDFSQPNRGSNDVAADKCGPTLEVDTEQIKNCAKGDEGITFLKEYGRESKKENFKFVPTVLVNGSRKDTYNFFKDVCAAFTRQPAPCVDQTSSNL